MLKICRKTRSERRRSGLLGFVFAALLLCSINAPNVSAQTQNDAQDEPQRGLVPIFEAARPPAKIAPTGKLPLKKPRRPATNSAVVQAGKLNVAAATPVYRRIRKKVNSGKIALADKPKPRLKPNNSQQIAAQTNRPPRPAQTNVNDLPVQRARQIGVTIWQLFENQANDGAANSAAALSEPGRLLTPVRVGSETLFHNGDLVRLSIESAKSGYLYIVNEELRADGTTGDSFLVFPSKRINNGNNRISPGKLIELPDLLGNPFYFELRPQNADGQSLLAEVLTIIITDRPIANLKIGAQPLRLSSKTIGEWRGKWAGRAEIFESQNAERTVYSSAERDAATGARLLTLADPLPNTIFLVENKPTGGALVTLPLWYARGND